MKKFINITKTLVSARFLFSLVLLLLLPHCAKYDSKRLKPPHNPVHEKDNIEITKKALTEEECKNYFGGRKAIARGYQPIQIYIKNKTNKIYYLDPNRITLPLEPVGNVARKFHRNIGWKVTKYFLIGGPIWAAIEGIASYDANKTIDTDFREKSVRTNKLIKIRPYGIINRIMFVAQENYTSNFSITLIEAGNKKQITFDL